jgi:hypothetical protein
VNDAGGDGVVLPDAACAGWLALHTADRFSRVSIYRARSVLDSTRASGLDEVGE